MDCEFSDEETETLKKHKGLTNDDFEWDLNESDLLLSKEDSIIVDNVDTNLSQQHIIDVMFYLQFSYLSLNEQDLQLYTDNLYLIKEILELEYDIENTGKTQKNGIVDVYNQVISTPRFIPFKNRFGLDSIVNIYIDIDHKTYVFGKSTKFYCVPGKNNTLHRVKNEDNFTVTLSFKHKMFTVQSLTEEERGLLVSYINSIYNSSCKDFLLHFTQ